MHFYDIHFLFFASSNLAFEYKNPAKSVNVMHI